MKKYIKYTSALALATVALTGCDDYLDTMPDNRTTLDSEEKIKAMLTSSYSDNEYFSVAELSSDNTDDLGESNPYSERFYDQAYAWIDETESHNESLENFWSGAYMAIASANEALAAINSMASTATIDECRGEALVSRAYNHFMLACMFCNTWTTNAAADLGLPYMEAPETELMPQYERGNLADFYDKIQADLEEGLKYIGDSHLAVPKYHFNTKAAYAFATRFYLYTEQWQKAIDYATKCLGSQPETMLRDWKGMASITQDIGAVANEYVSASSNSNLMLKTALSYAGVIWSSSSFRSGGCKRYSHAAYIANNEDMRATNIFGGYTMLWHTPKVYKASGMDRVIFWKYNVNMFEYTDPVGGFGYYRAVYPAFTSDECLLNRAEAYIMLKQYDLAAADLNTWMHNFTKSTKVLTPENIQQFYNAVDYSYEDDNCMLSTIKKHLNPAFAIDAEGSVQECMLQCMLGFRRLETMHAGLRWFDVKRYGIEIPRRTLNAAGNPEKITDRLTKDDPRRALQIPLKVRDAGIEANPRKQL